MAIRKELNEIIGYNPLLLCEAELSNSLDFHLFILCLASGNLLSERLHFFPASPPLWSRCRAKQRPVHDCSSRMVFQYFENHSHRQMFEDKAHLQQVTEIVFLSILNRSFSLRLGLTH